MLKPLIRGGQNQQPPGEKNGRKALRLNFTLTSKLSWCYSWGCLYFLSPPVLQGGCRSAWLHDDVLVRPGGQCHVGSPFWWLKNPTSGPGPQKTEPYPPNPKTSRIPELQTKIPAQLVVCNPLHGKFGLWHVLDSAQQAAVRCGSFTANLDSPASNWNTGIVGFGH